MSSAAPKPAPPKVSTTLARLQEINIKDMRVSEIAQRDLNEERVAVMSADFHPEQIGYLDVSHRDGAYWIVDGQHRHAVLMEKYPGGAMVMCKVYRGLTEKDEAELFLRLNDQLSVSAMDKYDKSIVAERPLESDVNRIVLAHGLRVARGNDPGHIQAVGTLVKIYTDHGPRVLSDTLNVLVPSFGDAGLYAGLLRGTASFLARYPEYDQERLVQKLSSLRGGLNGLRTRAEILHKQTGLAKQQCVSAVIVEIYNAGRGGKKLAPWFK